MTHPSLILPCVFLSIIQVTFSDVYVYNDANKLVEDYDDQPAGFGPPITSNGIAGYVTLTNPRNACTKIAPPPNFPLSKYRWIALIPRTKSEDTCDFDLKVQNAQYANFTAVIIYNFDDTLVTMGSRGRDIKIPSTLVMHSDGLAIIANYVYNESLTNSTPPFHLKITTEQLFRFGAYLIPFLCVISISFLGLIVFMLAKCYIQRRRLRRHRLPRSALKQLRIKKFVKGDRWEVCAICLDDFEEGAKMRILPCDHAYHTKCIDPWLLNNRRQCPICKRYVFPNHDNSDEEENHTHAVTERTPLIQSSSDNSISVLSRTHETERRMFNSASTEVSNFTSATINGLSDNEDEDHVYDNASSPFRQTRTISRNRITTNDLMFDSVLSDSENETNPQLSGDVLGQSNSDEIDNNTTRNTINTYESAQDSLPNSFTTPRAANFLESLSGNITDNTNISTHSVIEDDSDADTDNTDERMHSMSADSEINHAFVSDDENTNKSRTNL